MRIRLRPGIFTGAIASLGVCPSLTMAQATAASAVSAAASGVDAQCQSIAVELSRSLAWPAVAVLVGLAFWKPLSLFLTSLGGRISKLSAFKVEIELASAKSPPATPLLDEIKSETYHAPMVDSSRQMLEQVQSTAPADYTLIELGHGREWLSTRLFIAAVMMQRMRGVQAIVFVEACETTERRFVAVVGAGRLRWILAQRYPWLEGALVSAMAQVYQYPIEDPRTTQQQRITTDTGALEPWQAQQFVRNFLNAVQTRDAAARASPEPPKGWLRFQDYDERAEWLDRRLLHALLPEDAFQACIQPRYDDSRAKKSRALLRCRAPFVALLGDDGRFLRLLNRQKHLEELAWALGDEPEQA
jgi:hypothetical protein